MYELRKETIERVFADAKEKHGMRYTLYRGLAQVTNWVKLKFAAMNLKKLAIRKWKEGLYSDVVVIREEYQPSVYSHRNRYMVEHSDRVIAVYDGREKGGTAGTIRFF